MTEIRIPQAGDAVTEGKLLEWMFADGEKVEAGEVIYFLETDKAEIEIEAPCSGVLRHVGVEGEVYPVGALVARIE